MAADPPPAVASPSRRTTALRVIRRPRVLVVGAITAAVVATDLVAPGVSAFWAHHAMVAGVLSGLLLLGIGVWIVEGWLVEHGKPVVRQAYRSLATDLDDVVAIMRWCVLGNGDGAAAVPVGRGVDADCLQPVLSAQSSAPAGGYWKRLKFLVRNDEWRDATIVVLRICRIRLHEAGGRWAGVMMTSPELTDDLGRVADLSEQLGRLNGALADEDIASEVAGRWNAAQQAADDLKDRLYRTARSERYGPLHAEPYQPRRQRVRDGAVPPHAAARADVER